MAEMTKRERVERAMRLQETDRVPLYDLLLCDRAFEHFSGEQLPPREDTPEARAKADRMAGTAIARMLDATRSSGFGPLVDSEHTNAYGFRYHVDAREKTSWIVERPFEDVAGAAEYLKTKIRDLQQQTAEVKANPEATRQRHQEGFAATQARIGDTVHLLSQQGIGLDDVRVELGLELFSYVDADVPGLISEVLEAHTELNLATCHAIADVSLSPAVLTYGDIAYKQKLIHSPAWLRREFFPRLKRLNDAWHEHGLLCLFHSDGYLMDVMDDLVETGIDGLNPIETVAGMDLAEVRRQYPNLFLAGGIDMSQLLSNGTPEQVREVCRQAIRDVGPGFLMGSTTEADNSCQVENLIAMYEVAHEGY